MSRSYARRLRIEPGRSPRLALFIGFSHLLALLVALSLPIGLPARLTLATLIGLSLLQAVRAHVLRSGDRSLVAIELDGTDRWTLHQSDGTIIEQAVLHHSTFIHRHLIILNFERTRWRTQTLILTTDAVDPDLLRRLRVRIRR